MIINLFTCSVLCFRCIVFGYLESAYEVFNSLTRSLVGRILRIPTISCCLRKVLSSLFWWIYFLKLICYYDGSVYFISLGVVFTRKKQPFFKSRLTHIPTLNTGKLTFVSRKALLHDLHFVLAILP